MTNGMERWAAGSEENKQRAELLMRQFAAQSANRGRRGRRGRDSSEQ